MYVYICTYIYIERERDIKIPGSRFRTKTYLEVVPDSGRATKPGIQGVRHSNRNSNSMYICIITHSYIYIYI